MPLPSDIRALTPAAVRDHPMVRAVALAAGLIPPRTMHSDAEAATLQRLARGAHCVVELGVYEGSSAIVLSAAMNPGADLHLVDPFVDETGWTMRAGWRASPSATRIAVRRHGGRAGGQAGARIHWHIARSQDVGRAWRGSAVDLVFIDGDHSESGCREDWDVWHPHVAPGGAVAFHDARLGRPGGSGGPGPTAVVDTLFRGSASPPEDWAITDEVDSLVVVHRADAHGGA